MENLIYIPSSFTGSDHLPERVKVQISNLSSAARVERLPDIRLARLSPALATTLSVPPDLEWRFKWLPHSSTLRLGPVVAIFTRRSLIPDSTSGTAGELNCLGQVSTSLPGLFYLLRPEAVSLQKETWEGYIYRNQTWKEVSLPRPQAVYDQIYSRKSEHRSDVMEAKRVLLKVTGNHYFNPRYFNKWEINEALRRTEIKGIIPETRLLSSLTQVQQMVRTYGAVFLKPTNGTLGMGIIRVAHTGHGYTLTTGQGSVREFSSFKRAYEAARSYMTSKSYLVQQEIKLMRFNGHPVDVRILIQKDGSGKFRITKIFARVAPGQRIVTNLGSGGTALPLGQVIKAATGRSPEPVLKKLRSAAYRIATALERVTGTYYGELGIDVGVDRNSRLWLIEVNSKPRRAVESEGNPELVRLSYLRPLMYASYLAGFEEVVSHDSTESRP